MRLPKGFRPAAIIYLAVGSVYILLSLVACGTPVKYIPATVITDIPQTESSPVWVVTPPSTDASISKSDMEKVGLDHAQTGIEVVNFSPETFDWLTKSGAYWLRINGLDWSQVEPLEGNRNWEAIAELEADLREAAQNNLQVILVVRSTPEWAQAIPGSFCGPVRPDKIGAFASFMSDVVSRYSASPFGVRYWELGNEPDVDPSLVLPNSPFGCWGDVNDEYYGGGGYADMLKQVYPQIKTANPEVEVLVGGLLLDCDPIQPPENRDCLPARFLEGILKEGGGDFFDGISFHAYDYYIAPYGFSNSNWHSKAEEFRPVNGVKASYLRKLLKQYDLTDKFLINTEAGLICGREGNEPKCQSAEFNLTKAVYLTLLNANGLKEGLLGSVWYNLEGWRGTGLLDSSGRPLPASDVYRFISTQLNQAVYQRDITEVPGVTGIEFLRDGRIIWMLWSKDGKEHSLQFPIERLKIFDVWGNQIPGASEVKITSVPLYFEWIDNQVGK